MKLKQVAAQLYTLRDFLKEPKQIADTLKKVAKIGYKSVQVSGVGAIPEADLVKICDDLDLTICATHEGGDNIVNKIGEVITRLKKLKTKHTAYPFPHVAIDSVPNVKNLAKALNKSGKAMHEEGLVLSYHNHNHEFVKVGGKRVIDILIAETNPKYLNFEIDTYWAHLGGCENTELLSHLQGRVPLIHLKDYQTVPKENKPFFCEIGNGNLPFERIIPTAEKAGTKWFIVEQDSCPASPFDSLAQSFKYIKKNLAS